MLKIPHSQDHSLEILDPVILRQYAANPENPALVSFPRTGSHWLRILMELLFQRPTLVRAFYYFENRDYLCWHTHDDDLTFQRRNIIYLYREPVSTVYSQLRYLRADTTNAGTVEDCARQYRDHLTKWLLRESFTHRKLLISYRDLEKSPLATLQRLASFLRVPWDETRAREAIAYVTKDIVRLKTQEHDTRVIDTGVDYSTTKEQFTAQHAALIRGVIQAGDPSLQSFFSS